MCFALVVRVSKCERQAGRQAERCGAFLLVNGRGCLAVWLVGWLINGGGGWCARRSFARQFRFIIVVVGERASERAGWLSKDKGRTQVVGVFSRRRQGGRQAGKQAGRPFRVFYGLNL